jgi:hypothetical protein
LIIAVALNACSSDANDKQSRPTSNPTYAFALDSISNLPAIQFERALQYESKDDKSAQNIYRQIKNSDSLSFWGIQADIRLRFLTAGAVKRDFIKKISDTWDWNWKGANWGDIETKKKGFLERKLIIKETGEIEFYENEKLTRKDTYELRKPNDYNGDKYLIELKLSKEVFSLSYNKTRLTLSEPNCDCGCLTNEYFRTWKSGI